MSEEPHEETDQERRERIADERADEWQDGAVDREERSR